MDYSTDCPDDVLIEIFKNLDLKSRLLASQTCRKWNRLIKDLRSFMENVSISKIKERNKKILTSTLIHIGKAKELSLDTSDSTISSVSKMIRDDRLKIDQLFFTCSNDFDESECVNQLLPSMIDEDGNLLPSSITELHLSCEEGCQTLISDWSRFSKLEYLRLDNILIDTTTSKPPPKLKRLDLSWDCDQDQLDEKILFFIFALNTTTMYLSTLEELRLVFFRALAIETLKRLFVAINRLPKLRRLCFERCTFDGESAIQSTSTTKKLVFQNLKEIQLIDCDVYYISVAQAFLGAYTLTLDFLKIEALISIGDSDDDYTINSVKIDKIYNLAILAKERKTEFELNLRFAGDTSSILQNLTIPIEVGQTLAKLSLRDVPSLEFLRRHFDCFTYEKLTTIKLIQCKMNDDILKRIAQLCPYLETLLISDWKGKITENGLKWFLIYWQERKSMRLSIECPGSISVAGLFGTSFEKGNGILEDSHGKIMTTTTNEDENGEPLSKRQKKSDEKYWMVIRKTFSINDQNQNGTRLIIWDQDNSIGGDQKSLVIQDYGKDKLIKKLEI